MNWLDLLKSLLLILAGAGISGASESVRGLVNRSRVRAERVDQQAEVRRIEGREHAEGVLNLLNSLWNDLSAFRSDGANFFHVGGKRLRRLHGTYLLIPDVQIRELLMRGIWGISNPQALGDFLFQDEDDLMPTRRRPELVQIQLVFAMRSSLAAYLRGDVPEPKSVRLLGEVHEFLRERYELS